VEPRRVLRPSPDRGPPPAAAAHLARGVRRLPRPARQPTARDPGRRVRRARPARPARRSRRSLPRHRRQAGAAPPDRALPAGQPRGRRPPGRVGRQALRRRLLRRGHRARLEPRPPAAPARRVHARRLAAAADHAEPRVLDQPPAAHRRGEPAVHRELRGGPARPPAPGVGTGPHDAGAHPGVHDAGAAGAARARALRARPHAALHGVEHPAGQARRPLLAEPRARQRLRRAQARRPAGRL
ncbi:MAG: hypothetical protein AVDCRST_MAG85-2960, partial [uncultured Solirubrobacteraceae bacterium]